MERREDQEQKETRDGSRQNLFWLRDTTLPAFAPLAGEISREDYDRWRYYYPEFDSTQIWAKVPSKDLSDALIQQLSGWLKDK